jgi:hypothetical protein
MHYGRILRHCPMVVIAHGMQRKALMLNATGARASAVQSGLLGQAVKIQAQRNGADEGGIGSRP